MAEETSKITCRGCKFGDKNRPDHEKVPPGKLWCICYKREFSGNHTCPKAEASNPGASQGSMMKQRLKGPKSKAAFY